MKGAKEGYALCFAYCLLLLTYCLLPIVYCLLAFAYACHGPGPGPCPFPCAGAAGPGGTAKGPWRGPRGTIFERLLLIL